ncbi:DHA2 family lincomycin resistance protein-like MFS transporter [Cryobacterium mesophilum]|uniref:DHA2 family efflux MFS transporter permease subunit n=1 Tax=Terrimesophilobacter mesophilus TaxID=433647 RepID=A0A4R8V940_9MICO|nr:MDR family MFS transporter [Terrimesophilobacter mesophilus]MBB5632419.1 DHA2 family lincomycin resistance protein-like MFS transporter [Terrimesophilobacter mesophilus]TFB79253.1 DHA2 family efflux MFS transporter permease subunit [Terrimesophilobacter mesophilus]
MTEPAVPTLDDAAADTTAVAESAATSARNRLVIGLMLVSAFVVILNETLMGVALPVLMRDLHVSANAAQWLSTAFMLTMAVVIPITGWLIQRFNTRPVFIAAMILFSTGTLIAAIAPGFTVLLVARVVQASGTAIMMPLLFTTVMTLVPPAARGRTMGNISIVISVAPALGPTISGLILSVLDWRWMFILVLPIALGALALGYVRIRNVTTPKPTHFDVLSVIVSAFGFGGLVYGLSNLGAVAEGGNPLSGWLPLGVGIVALAVFIVRQLQLQRRDDALLDLRTFRSRQFTLSITMIVVSMLALFGTVILLPIYLQNVLGLDTLGTGLLLLPGGLLMGLLAPIVGRIYDRIGPTALVITGSVLVSVVFWGMATFTENTAVWWVLAAHITLSLALALMFTPLFTSGLGALTPDLYSHGSAIVGTVQQVAGAAGTALFVTIMTARAASLAGDGATDVTATAGGIQLAFLAGAIISMFVIPIAAFIRRPADTVDGSPPGAH